MHMLAGVIYADSDTSSAAVCSASTHSRAPSQNYLKFCALTLECACIPHYDLRMIRLLKKSTNGLFLLERSNRLASSGQGAFLPNVIIFSAKLRAAFAFALVVLMRPCVIRPHTRLANSSFLCELVRPNLTVFLRCLMIPLSTSLQRRMSLIGLHQKSSLRKSHFLNFCLNLI